MSETSSYLCLLEIDLFSEFGLGLGLDLELLPLDPLSFFPFLELDLDLDPYLGHDLV